MFSNKLTIHSNSSSSSSSNSHSTPFPSCRSSPSSSFSLLFSSIFIGLLLLLAVAISPSMAFEFDLIPVDPSARQFGPSQGGPAAAQRALLFADTESNLEDTAGFVSGLPVSARRRLIQPPPLKRSAGPMRAQRMDWLLAGLRPRGE